MSLAPTRAAPTFPLLERLATHLIGLNGRSVPSLIVFGFPCEQLPYVDLRALCAATVYHCTFLYRAWAVVTDWFKP